jgi:hypothetical protein
MSRPAIIKQADAERLFAAARKAGLHPSRAKLTRDGLELVFASGSDASLAEPNPWDEESDGGEAAPD